MSLVVAGLAVAGAIAYQAKTASDAAGAQEDALERQNQMQRESLEQSKKAQEVSQQNINRASQKRPDMGTIMQKAQESARGGVAGTMLTGPQGVAPELLKLGKNTLLGG